MKKVIVVQFNIQVNKVETFIKLAKAMVLNSNQEMGCLTYKLLKNLEEENEFFMYEEYINEKAYENHCSSEYLMNFVNLVTEILKKEPIVQVFNG